MNLETSLTKAILVGLLVAAAGCFSLQKGRLLTTNQEQVLVSNYGWYLFHAIPLACGNANFHAFMPWVMFRDDVTLEKTQGRFMNYAKGQGAEVSDLVYRGSESVMLRIPGLNIPLPIPYLLTYREIQLSGVLTQPLEPIAMPEDAE